MLLDQIRSIVAVEEIPVSEWLKSKGFDICLVDSVEVEEHPRGKVRYGDEY